MPLLENSTVLLISPQPWNHIHLSKHHYAIELSHRGNAVFFLDPPVAALAGGMDVARVSEHPGISVVRYQPRVPLVLRFHARRMFDLLMLLEIGRILTAIGQPLDVLWSFEFNLFSDLRAFRAPLTLFHPVDPLSSPRHVSVATSADAVLSVSSLILSNFRNLDTPSFFINHGLSESFAEVARSPVRAAGSADGVVRVGYAGNLTRPPVNRDVIRQMVSDNPLVEFNFWGPFDALLEPATAVSSEVSAFIGFLASRPNARLHGPVSAAVLAVELQQMDCMVLSYTIDRHESDRSNSHKILEYLSTGKVVVSSLISTYSDHRQLLRMPDNGDDALLPALLRDTLDRLDEFNAPDLQNARRQFALDNTYTRQLDRIDALVAPLAGYGKP